MVDNLLLYGFMVITFMWIFFMLDYAFVELNNTYTYLQEHELDNSISRINTVEYNDKVKEFKRDISSSKISLNNYWVNWFTSSVYKEYTGNEVQYLKGE